MHLLLASYRFDKPLVQVYRTAIPFLLPLLFVVLLITYIPALTIGSPLFRSGLTLGGSFLHVGK